MDNVQERLAALARHLDGGAPASSAGLHVLRGSVIDLNTCCAAHAEQTHCLLPAGVVPRGVSAPQPRARPTPGGGAGTLTVVDNRTGKKYEIKVTRRPSSLPSTDLRHASVRQTPAATRSPSACTPCRAPD